MAKTIQIRINDEKEKRLKDIQDYLQKESNESWERYQKFCAENKIQYKDIGPVKISLSDTVRTTIDAYWLDIWV